VAWRRDGIIGFLLHLYGMSPILDMVMSGIFISAGTEGFDRLL